MRVSRRRWLIGLGLTLLVVMGALLVIPGSRAIIRGLFRNEPFHQGKPASAWSQALQEERQAGPPVILSQGDPPGAIRAFLGADSHKAVPVLLVLLDDEDEYVRRRAAEALGIVRPQDDTVVSALTNHLIEDDSQVRWQSARALGRIGTRAAAALPALGAASRESNEVVRLEAVRALTRVGAPGEAVPFLIERLRDEDMLVRWETADLLGRLGPGARDAVPALRAALEDESEFVRDAAKKALQEIKAENGKESSEGRHNRKYARRDSNPQPLRPKRSALSS